VQKFMLEILERSYVLPLNLIDFIAFILCIFDFTSNLL